MTNKRRPCVALWKTPQMAWNGELGVCCMDVGMNLSIGNLNDKSFEELWLGERIKKWRMHHIRGDFEKAGVKKKDGSFWSCADCPGISTPLLKDEEVVQYLEIIGEQKEIVPFLKRVNSPLSEKYEEKTRKSWLKSKWLSENWWLTLELSGKCNLNCPNCSQKVSKIKGEHMDMKLFNKLVTGIFDSGLKFNSLTPFYRGESLLHPDFKKMLSFLNKYQQNWGFITLHTNATTMNKEISDALLDSFEKMPYGEMYFSLDAATEKTYNIVRQGGNFKQVIDNITYFIDEKQRRNIKYPLMVFQFIVRKENVKEAKQFYDFWSRFLEKRNIPFILNKSYDRLIEVFRIKSNVIYFRRLETNTPEQKDNLELQKQAYRQLNIIK